MLTDKFKLVHSIIQINFDEAYILWDKAGHITKQMSLLWPEKKLKLGNQTGPNLQVLESDTLTIASRLDQATITLLGHHVLDETLIERLTKTIKIWITELEITELSRFSMRMINHINYSSISEANKDFKSLGLVKFPEEKIFGQPMDSEKNNAELLYRFQTDDSFTFLKLSTEQVIYEFNKNPEIDDKEITDTEKRISKNRLIVDFDRGFLSKTPINKFIIDEWIKGNVHIFRRDISKVVNK